MENFKIEGQSVYCYQCAEIGVGLHVLDLLPCPIGYLTSGGLWTKKYWFLTKKGVLRHAARTLESVKSRYKRN